MTRTSRHERRTLLIRLHAQAQVSQQLLRLLEHPHLGVSAATRSTAAQTLFHCNELRAGNPRHPPSCRLRGFLNIAVSQALHREKATRFAGARPSRRLRHLAVCVYAPSRGLTPARHSKVTGIADAPIFRVSVAVVGDPRTRGMGDAARRLTVPCPIMLSFRARRSPSAMHAPSHFCGNACNLYRTVESEMPSGPQLSSPDTVTPFCVLSTPSKAEPTHKCNPPFSLPVSFSGTKVSPRFT